MFCRLVNCLLSVSHNTRFTNRICLFLDQEMRNCIPFGDIAHLLRLGLFGLLIGVEGYLEVVWIFQRSWTWVLWWLVSAWIYATSEHQFTISMKTTSMISSPASSWFQIKQTVSLNHQVEIQWTRMVLFRTRLSVSPSYYSILLQTSHH